MLFLITEIFVCLIVAAALGALVAWLAKDLLVRRERDEWEATWQRRLRDSEARAGTFKNQLAEVKQNEVNLRADLRLLEETTVAPGPTGGATVAALEAELARRDKKIEVLKLQVEQSEAALTSEWQSLKALKTEVAERQRRLDSRGKERDAGWADKLKAAEEAQRRLKEQIVALKHKLSGVQEAAEQAVAEARRRTAARTAELEKHQNELQERDATVARLTEALKRDESEEDLPIEEEDLPIEEDNLEQLRGIGPVLHRKLNELGIRSFAQIASWTDDDVERVGSQVGAFPNRIRRDQWIEKARELQQAKAP